MLEDFSSKAGKYIAIAESLAFDLGHCNVGSEHLLLSFLKLKDVKLDFKLDTNIVNAFSKILVSYDKKGKMPSYIAVKSLSSSTSSAKGAMNMKNTITALSAYLAASKNCDVNNAKINITCYICIKNTNNNRF